MKYEYKAINAFAIKQQRMKESGTPESVSHFEIMNEEGLVGWKCLNPWDGQTLYFEREVKEKKGK